MSLSARRKPRMAQSTMKPHSSGKVSRTDKKKFPLVQLSQARHVSKATWAPILIGLAGAL